MGKFTARKTTVGAVARRTPVAVMVTASKESGISFAAPGVDGAFLAYAAFLDSKTEGTVVKFGNEQRIVEPGEDTEVHVVPTSALHKDPEAALTDIRWVSTCQHLHDQDKTGLPVSWSFRVMKPGATSFSGICLPCAAKDSACIGGSRDDKVGTAIFRQTVVHTGSCVEKREAIRAKAAAEAAARKAAKAAEKAKATEDRLAPAIAAEEAPKAPAKRTRKTAQATAA